MKIDFNKRLFLLKDRMIPQSPNGSHEDLEVSVVFDTSEIEIEGDEDDDIVECPYCCQTRLEGCECEEEIEEGEGEEESEEETEDEEEECTIEDSYFDPGVRRYCYRED